MIKTLDLCRELYNAALQERRDAYRMRGKSLNYYDQANQLAALKEARPDLKEIHSQVLQDALKRVQKAFDGFFRRLKTGQTPGFPRFQGRNRYASFTFPQGGWSLKNDKLTLSKIGQLKIKLHRQAIGKVKTCTIKREGDKWFVCFAVEQEQEIPAHPGPAVGIDVGLENLLNLSNGEQVANPRYFRQSEKRLAKAQRRLAKIPMNSPLRRKFKKRVRLAFGKVRHQRLDFAHKLSHKIATTYSLIAVEDLNIKGLASGRLAKSVNDAAWSLFLRLLDYKAEWAGSKLVRVDPRQTSHCDPFPRNLG